MNKTVAVILMLFFGVVLCAGSMWDAVAYLKKPYDISEADMEDVKPGDHVTMDITAAASLMISQTTTTTNKYGTTTSSRESARYYLIPLVEERGRDIYIDHYFILKVTDDFSAMDRAVREFNDWWEDDWAGMDEYPSSTAIELDGRVRAMTSKERSHVESYIDDPDYEDYLIPYIVMPLGKRSVTTVIALIGICLIVGAVLIAVFGIVKWANEKPQREEAARQEAAQRAQYYQAPTDVHFNNDNNGSGSI